MRALEAQHESEERELLGVPVSAPTTPPRSDGNSEHVGIQEADGHRSRARDPSQYGNIGVLKTSAFREYANNSKSVPPADVTRVKMTIYWEWTSSLLVVSETLWQREVLLISIPTLHVSLTISPLCASRPFSKNGARHAQKLTNSSHDAPSVTSFLFDDELEADLQREYLHQCNLRISALNHAFPFTPIAGFLS